MHIINRNSRKEFLKIYKFKYTSEIYSAINEVELLKELNGHKKVVTMINANFNFSNFNNDPNDEEALDGDEERKLYIFMEYCSNGDLFDYISKRNSRKNPFKFKEIWTNLQEFSELLSDMQVNNKAHRDIKPENFVVTEDGQIKLADFGEGKTFSNYNKNTVRGTLFYGSPEMQRAHAECNAKSDYNPYKSDVYSLGLVFLSMISQENFNPYKNRYTQIIEKVNKITHPALKLIIINMLKESPEERFDFLELKNFIEGVKNRLICCSHVIQINSYIDFECSHCEYGVHSECVGTNICISCRNTYNIIMPSSLSKTPQNQTSQRPDLIDFSSEVIKTCARELCFHCNARLEVNSYLGITQCSNFHEVCTICKISHGDGESCARDDCLIDITCHCLTKCKLDRGLLFYACDRCGIICRMCLRNDISISHLNCAKSFLYL